MRSYTVTWKRGGEVALWLESPHNVRTMDHAENAKGWRVEFGTSGPFPNFQIPRAQTQAVVGVPLFRNFRIEAAATSSSPNRVLAAFAAMRGRLRGPRAAALASP
jgi:hypothetical protein